tara:strand:+ start:128 stop:472 length:345 start_codon:yes stop_codon:yes gene_type:complete
MNIGIVKPISPDEIMDNLESIIPSFVIEAVNNLLKDKYRGGRTSIKAKDIIEEALRLSVLKVDSVKVTREMIYDKKWMDFETIYRANGWKVSFEKSTYGDTNFDSYYEFLPKKI